MRIEDLKSFVVLADVGSFHAASERLGVTQPALSRRIQKLEEQLQTKLLHRTTQQVSLTSAGLVFLERIRPIVLEAETAIHEIRSSGKLRRGTVRIACLPTFSARYLPDILREMHALRPQLSYQVQDANALGVAQRMASGRFDVGFGMRVGDASQLNYTQLYEESIGILCHRDHPCASITDLTWPDLTEHAFVYNLSDSGNWLLIMNRLEKEGLTVNRAHQVSSLFNLFALVRAGIALGMVPRTFADMLSDQELIFKEVRDPSITRSIHLITGGNEEQPQYTSNS